MNGPTNRQTVQTAIVRTALARKVKQSKVYGYSSSQFNLPHRYGIGSHSVTCHPTEVTFPPLPQPKLVLDEATPEGDKAELT